VISTLRFPSIIRLLIIASNKADHLQSNVDQTPPGGAPARLPGAPRWRAGSASRCPQVARRRASSGAPRWRAGAPSPVPPGGAPARFPGAPRCAPARLPVPPGGAPARTPGAPRWRAGAPPRCPTGGAQERDPGAARWRAGAPPPVPPGGAPARLSRCPRWRAGASPPVPQVARRRAPPVLNSTLSKRRTFCEEAPSSPSCPNALG